LTIKSYQLNKLVLIFFTTLLFSNLNCAQVYIQEDIEICRTKFQLAINTDLSSKPINEVIIEIGKSFIGEEYEAHTLEITESERLVINLRSFDCNTFIENVLALSSCIKKNNSTFEDFQNELKLIRYRNGKLNGYPSRLHYFTDWIFDNVEKGIIKDITEEIGGVALKLNLSFMSNHPQYYKHLKDNPDFIPLIKRQEENINSRDHNFIPQNKIEEVESKIQSGDILAFTSTIEGLDVNHVGIAVRMKDDRIHVLHAPVPGSKVQITKLPLYEYVKRIENDSGIIVVKVLEPVN
jgi:hypothetical protein